MACSWPVLNPLVLMSLGLCFPLGRWDSSIPPQGPAKSQREPVMAGRDKVKKAAFWYKRNSVLELFCHLFCPTSCLFFLSNLLFWELKEEQDTRKVHIMWPRARAVLSFPKQVLCHLSCLSLQGKAFCALEILFNGGELNLHRSCSNLKRSSTSFEETRPHRNFSYQVLNKNIIMSWKCTCLCETALPPEGVGANLSQLLVRRAWERRGKQKMFLLEVGVGAGQE